MPSHWPVWCEIVCSRCSSVTAGQFNTTKFNKGQMRKKAMAEGWDIVADDWLCVECVKRALIISGQAMPTQKEL
jgi:hypothetical protein